MEQWKVIPGFEQYAVSDTGKVVRKGHCLIPSTNNRGYLFVQLWGNKRCNKRYIHRLVAEAFVPNTNNKPEVNHIDNNPLNNNADNLEWVTHYENLEHARLQHRALWMPGVRERAIEGSKRTCQKKVIGICLADGSEIYFNGVNETSFKGFNPSCVSNCCNGKRATHGGYIWRFDES